MFTKFYLCMELTTKSPKIWLILFEQNIDSIILKFDDIFKSRLNNCPKYILVENVKGFEDSETCLKLHETLMKCNFTYQVHVFILILSIS